MRSANSENSRLAESSGLPGPDWVSIPDIVQRLSEREIEVSERQLERWREAKLLPAGAHVIDRPGHGSVYRYPPETADLALAIHGLQTEKNDLAWIGWELWWRGYPAPEGCWRPELSRFAKEDRPVFRRLRHMMRREREGGDDDRTNTLADEVATSFALKATAGRIASRIKGRLTSTELPVVVRVILEAASGITPEYEPGPNPADEQILFKAMSFGTLPVDPATDEPAAGAQYRDDKLAGQTIRVREAIGPVLKDMAKAMRRRRLVEAAKAPSAELEAARDDIKAAMEMASELYQSTRWIYGRKALGLHFINWVATKSSARLLRRYVLIWVQIRRARADLLSRGEIQQLHSQAMQFSKNLEFLKLLSAQGGALSILCGPKNLKKVLSDPSQFAAFGTQLRHELNETPEIRNRLTILISENRAIFP